MKHFLEHLKSGKSLSRTQAKDACSLILSGQTEQPAIVELLKTLHHKQESEDEILGFMDAIQETTLVFPESSENLMDVCGTGGDGAQTFNVSTGVAIVLASLGIKIAKHGNKGVSSRSGSSDVLQALNIKNDESISAVEESLARHKISFLFAPAFYPILAKLAPIRKSISGPTLFNALGPLLNPAKITHQLMGVYDESLLVPCIQVLKARGLKIAFVVHGADRLDEFTLAGKTHVAALTGGEIKYFTLTPRDFELPHATAEEVRGGTPLENAAILMRIFSGERSAKRDLIVINAAASLVLAEQETNYAQAARRVEQVLDSGATLKLMHALQNDQRVSP